MEDDHICDLTQWLVESSSSGQSEHTLKQFAATNTLLIAVRDSNSPQKFQSDQ